MERNRNLFWKLLEPDHPKAEAFSRKLMGNREDGDDLYQDALVLALTKFSSLRETAAFRPWLYRIIVNCFNNRFRTPWYRKVIPMTEEISQSLKTADPNHGFAVSGLLRKAMSAISADERALVTLFEIEGWTVAELASVYQCPEGTIKARLSRARKKMKDALLRKLKDTNGANKVVLKSVSHSPSNLTSARTVSSTASTVSRMYHE
jgi:RNA polymerase sigma-70 factor, ECF subfamily